MTSNYGTNVYGRIAHTFTIALAASGLLIGLLIAVAVFYEPFGTLLEKLLLL